MAARKMIERIMLLCWNIKASSVAGVAKHGQRREIFDAKLRCFGRETSSLRGSWVQIPPPAFTVLSHAVIIKIIPPLVITSNSASYA